MHWTDKRPNRPGRWARRWIKNTRGWQVVVVYREGGTLWCDGTKLKNLCGYQWSSEPYPEPTEQEAKP